MRNALIWAALLAVLILPVIAAAFSPLLAWREPIYIGAGFAGIIGMALILLQPLLAGGYLPGLPPIRGRRVHRWIGGTLILAVVIHVAGLWVTSPPDVIDALLFTSPTPFSAWGVIAMWAMFASGALALLRRRIRLRPRHWRMGHTSLAVIIVVGSVVHALLIEGTMEPLTKAALCALVLLATVKAVTDLRAWARRARQR